MLQEVVRQMREGRTDVQSDPVLFKACAGEVKRFCGDMPFGRGKGMITVLNAYNQNTDKEI